MYTESRTLVFGQPKLIALQVALGRRPLQHLG